LRCLSKIHKKIKIKTRSPNEVWNPRNKNIQVINQPFDKTKLKDITGIISEHGILKQKDFVKKAKEKLSNLQG
jgi:methylthioribose-1-phosphate isomerase